MIKFLNIKTLFNYHPVVLLCFVFVSFVFDFINKTDIFYNLELQKFSKILKGVFLLYSLIFILTHVKYVYKNFKVLYSVLILLSATFLLKNNFSELYVIEFIRYVFPLVIFPLICYAYINRSEELLEKLYKFFKWFIIVNIGLVSFGLLFGIAIFKTYNSHRFGFNGVILSQGVTPYIYMCSTTLFWVFRDKIMLLLVVILSILSGVKGVYLGEFLLLSMLVFWSKNLSKALKNIIIVIFSLGFLFLLLFLYSKPVFREVFDSHGLLSAILSHRNDYTAKLINQITPDNYSLLIGATGLQKVRLELQIIDIVLFFGVIGLICYSVFLVWLYKSLVRTDVSKAFFISVIALSALSGNLLYIPLSLILMFLVLIALKKQGN